MAAVIVASGWAMIVMRIWLAYIEFVNYLVIFFFYNKSVNNIFS